MKWRRRRFQRARKKAREATWKTFRAPAVGLRLYRRIETAITRARSTAEPAPFVAISGGEGSYEGIRYGRTVINLPRKGQGLPE
jgi:hypothetical protein